MAANRVGMPRESSGKAQKLRVPSPLRPQTTMAIEKLKMAASEAQPRVISMGFVEGGPSVPRLGPAVTSQPGP